MSMSKREAHEYREHSGSLLPIYSFSSLLVIMYSHHQNIFSPVQQKEMYVFFPVTRWSTKKGTEGTSLES